ncbi:hypothetical protein HELRODRAFT_104178 [Helobdella robusta]|uniref:EF-hand domain-containing protein n=1 Tax=Helobdella robusta TaxID=6412 RepID=T1EDK1_HELRO|nr:hypothetical protein HELRODRAFT_104178 [Helobdella robusta]ESN91884.1 hypothetical protein HELRODRAFT_104178 [Helobdella robusta]
MTRFKPTDLTYLCRNTNFTKHELQTMYRGFKQECPSGIVDEGTFKEIYSRFFPYGDSSGYAHLVFKLFDLNKTGAITFEGLVSNLSILIRGSLEDRIKWIFRLYDVNCDGVISRDELMTVVNSIYRIIQIDSSRNLASVSVAAAIPASRASENVATTVIDDAGDGIVSQERHVENIFKMMDKNKDGLIDLEEFLSFCLKEEVIINGIKSMDTYFCF